VDVDDNATISQEELQNCIIVEQQERNSALCLHTSDEDRPVSAHSSIHNEEVKDEPFQRHSYQEQPYVIEILNSRTTCDMLRVPSVILILVQGAPNVIPFGITSVFLNDYLSQDKGLTTEVSIKCMELCP